MTETKTSIGTAVLIYVALLILLAATVAAAYLNLGSFNLVLSLGFALLKALLIILFFMHVKASSRLVKLFAAAGLLWLAILFTLTLSDYLSRIWVPVLNQLQ